MRVLKLQTWGFVIHEVSAFCFTGFSHYLAMTTSRSKYHMQPLPPAEETWLPVGTFLRVITFPKVAQIDFLLYHNRPKVDFAFAWTNHWQKEWGYHDWHIDQENCLCIVGKEPYCLGGKKIGFILKGRSNCSVSNTWFCFLFCKLWILFIHVSWPQINSLAHNIRQNSRRRISQITTLYTSYLIIFSL